MHFVVLLIILIPFISAFTPDRHDYDKYGLKIAANDVLFVQARNSLTDFLVQFAPYDYTRESLQCEISFDDTAHYIYSVGVAANHQITCNCTFYFIGEVAPQDGSGVDSSNRNGSFIGIAINYDPSSVLSYTQGGRSLNCDLFVIDQMQFFPYYEHQEYFVMAVVPNGDYALVFATKFAFKYQPRPVLNLITYTAANLWPNNATFYPCAVDSTDTFTIIAGFVEITGRTRIHATPTVYLLLNSNFTIVSTWSYSATNGSWQSRLTYSQASTWSKKYTMSVKINLDDTTRVLVGMPFLNAVFLFSIGNGGTSLQLASSLSNGRAVGFGKSVTWLTDTQASILVSTYSSDYQTWSSSHAYIYTSFNGTTIPSSPTSVIPNSQQPLPSTVNGEWIRMVSTPDSLAILDIHGGSMLILAQQPGYFAGTDSDLSPVTASMPVISFRSRCIGGTYKTDTGVHPCTLCPSGTLNSGMNAATSCLNCSSNSFCPLGALYELNTSYIESISQAYAYPKSPEMDVFEDILLHNMLSFGASGHCVKVSPLFWTLILVILFFLLLIGMASMNLCFGPEKSDELRDKIKNVFQRTDLVGEGELWLGGLVSIGVLLFSGMAYGFAISYMYQYPAEKVGPSNFACDTEIRNAKYQSNLQALAVPVSDAEQPMFTMLNEQNFTMTVEFLNTNMDCPKITIYEVIDSSASTLALSSCSYTNGTLSMTMLLPEHDVTIRIVLDDNQLIGGIRMGLTGAGRTSPLYTLQELNFKQAFYSTSSRTLSQTATIQVSMTKVVNETEPLFGSDSEYGGIWYPIFTYSSNDMFVTQETYVMSANLSSTTITFDFVETSYYIKNVQSPIAKQPEVVFRTLLFAFLCLEICAMTFLLSKLIFIPLSKNILRFYHRRFAKKTHPSDYKAESVPE